MSAQRTHTGLTYAEVIEWAVFLGTFTAGDLANEMGVDLWTGGRCVEALVHQRVCRNTGDMIDGPNGYEYVIEYVQPPPGPTTRVPSGPDPIQQAISQAGRIVVERGNQVRIRTERKSRRGMSTPGQRQKMKNQERNYKLQVEAKAKRAAAQKEKAKKEPKWKKKK